MPSMPLGSMDSETGGNSDWGCIHRLSLGISNVGGPKLARLLSREDCARDVTSDSGMGSSLSMIPALAFCG
jgi:hypothetical protein